MNCRLYALVWLFLNCMRPVRFILAYLPRVQFSSVLSRRCRPYYSHMGQSTARDGKGDQAAGREFFLVILAGSCSRTSINEIQANINSSMVTHTLTCISRTYITNQTKCWATDQFGISWQRFIKFAFHASHNFINLPRLPSHPAIIPRAHPADRQNSAPCCTWDPPTNPVTRSTHSHRVVARFFSSREFLRTSTQSIYLIPS